MNDHQKQILLQRIDEVLFYVWDPIAVHDTPEARDEYSSYADQVWRMVVGGKTKAEVSDYLTQVVAERMELRPHKSADDQVVKLIWDWKDCLEGSGRRV